MIESQSSGGVESCPTPPPLCDSNTSMGKPSSDTTLEERLQFEELIVDLAARLINVPPDEVDQEITHGLQRIIEFLRSLPAIPLWLTLAAVLPPHWSSISVYFGITVILSLIGWTGIARVVRGRFLSLREEDFILAARLANANTLRIILRHMVPSFLSYIIASLTLSIPGMILGETGLSFIGLGLQAPAISWGVLLQESQNLRSVVLAPWVLLPAPVIIVTVLAFNFLGDGLRDAADPYAR